MMLRRWWWTYDGWRLVPGTDHQFGQLSAVHRHGCFSFGAHFLPPASALVAIRPSCPLLCWILRLSPRRGLLVRCLPLLPTLRRIGQGLAPMGSWDQSLVPGKGI